MPIQRSLVVPAVAAALLIAGCSAETREANELDAAMRTATMTPTVVSASASPTASLTEVTSTSTPVAAAAPRYAFPLSPIPPASFDPQVNGHPYPAADIFAAAGTDVVAVTAGVIGFVNRVDGWSDPPNDGATRGGVYLSVVGDDGLQYYFSHLADIRADLDAGARVEAGDLVGHAGTSGNARFTPPHVHFGISCPTAQDDWKRRVGEFDPIPYLLAWSAGDGMASPAEAYGATCEAAGGLTEAG